MAIPEEVDVGDFLEAGWLNELRSEVKKNVVTDGNGINITRGATGTTVSLATGGGEAFGLDGIKGVALNDTGEELQPYWFAGISEVVGRDNMVGNFDSVSYVLRKPTVEDLFGRLVMIGEPMYYDTMGEVVLRSESIVTRVKYATDGTQDEWRFATIDTTVESGEDAYLLTAARSGGIVVLDVEDKDDNHPDWRWAIVRFPYGDKITDYVFKATADEAGGEITCKMVDSAGVVSGDTFTFKVLP